MDNDGYMINSTVFQDADKGKKLEEAFNQMEARR